MKAVLVNNTNGNFKNMVSVVLRKDRRHFQFSHKPSILFHDDCVSLQFADDNTFLSFAKTISKLSTLEILTNFKHLL